MTRRAAPGIAFVCERCGRAVYLSLAAGPKGATCPACDAHHPLRYDPVGLAARRLEACYRCGLDRLYAQKDFNRKLGLGVFVVAAVLSVPTWGLSLLAATLLDLGLYFVLADVVVCYGCNTQHRGFARNPNHGAFDLHVAEAIDNRPRAVQE